MTAQGLLDSGLREIRRVSPPDVPWAATVVSDAEGRTQLLVASSEIGDWAGWDSDRQQHVCGIEQRLIHDGADSVLFPLLNVPVLVFLCDDRTEHATMTDGELVTIAVSVIRGVCEEARTHSARDCSGRWWLTGEGRPVFVHGEGMSIREETSTVVHQIRGVARADHQRLHRACDALLNALGTGVTERIGECEAGFFAAATPQAVQMHRRDVRFRGPDDYHPTGGTPHLWSHTSTEVRQNEISGRHGMAWLRMQTSRVRVPDTLRRGYRRFTELSRRKKIFLCAGLGFVFIVIVALFWPEGESAGAVTVPSSTTAAQSSARQANDIPSAQAPADSTLSPEEIVQKLLTQSHNCAGDRACLVDVQDSSVPSLLPGAAAAPADGRVITLIDDYGGAFAVRVQSRDGQLSAQMILAIFDRDQWRIARVTPAHSPGG